MDRVFRVGDFPNTFAQQGWQCPICGRVYSPTTAMCFYCGNQKTVLTTEKTYKIDYAPDHGTTSGIDYTKLNI